MFVERRYQISSRGFRRRESGSCSFFCLFFFFAGVGGVNVYRVYVSINDSREINICLKIIYYMS